MDRVETLRQFLLAQGAGATAVVAVKDMVFDPAFRPQCEKDACGCYGKNHMCPPDIGDIHTLIAEAKGYDSALVYQTVSRLEDSYDYEGMMEAGRRHHALTVCLRDKAADSFPGGVLHLGAGGCRECAVCAKREEAPCRHPDRAVSSLEAYGIHVSRLAETAGCATLTVPIRLPISASCFITVHKQEEFMKRDMDKWLEELRQAPVKKALPILSFPATQLMDICVKELVLSSENQATAMQLVAERTDAAASVSLMDLSVEAECFGSVIHFADNEVPTVTERLVEDEEAADALTVPAVGGGRTGICIEAIRLAAQRITDRPVLAGVIGPFSLAGRLLDVTDIFIDCYEEPEKVHTVLEKCTDFIINYCRAFKDAGANGVVIAEPLAGLLSPSLAEAFSEPYVRRLVEAVQEPSFAVIYHNCGNGTIAIIDSILRTGASAYHFGNAIDMAEMMPHIPADTIAMGNVDPAAEFFHGTPASVRAATHKVMEACCSYPNFVISSGCDIPPASPWENIDAFFAAVKEFYA